MRGGGYARRFTTGLLLALPAAGLGAMLLGREPASPETGLGWLLAALNAAAKHWINARALAAGPEGFLRWSVGANGARFFALLACAVAVAGYGALRLGAVLVSLVFAYVVFMVLEIGGLHAQAVEGEQGA